jgi:hypothetical protein
MLWAKNQKAGKDGGVNRTFILAEDAHRERFKQFLDRQPFPLQVETGPVRHQRSTSQNSRLWALHGMAAKETGHSADELHELMLCKHYGTREIEVGGVRMTVPLKRSSTREKQEFRDFMDFVENFYASELGLWLEQAA